MINAEQMFKKLEEKAALKYISLEELDVINAQIAELGWCNSDYSMIPDRKEESHG